MRIVYNEIGVYELIVSDDCGWDDFYRFADQLQSQLNIIYKDRLNDFDSCYWSFDFERCDMMAHYNIFLGISIYPERCKLASQTENQKVAAIYKNLKA